MNELDKALYDKLRGDSALTDLLPSTTAIYEHEAPENTSPPFVLFEQASGSPSFTLAAKAWDAFTYLVKGITQEDSSKAAKTIAARLEAVLSDTTLTISAHQQMLCRKQSEVKYVEGTGPTRYNHAGALWRIWVA